VQKDTAKNIVKRHKKIEKRLERRNWESQSRPMLGSAEVRFEVDGRYRGIPCGGIGTIHTMCKKIGLVKRIDTNLGLLKRHLPYFDSDHILNLAFNILVGGQCVNDIERLRNDEGYLDALGAATIPDPTTEGDFVRRFKTNDIIALMEMVNETRKTVWEKQPPTFFNRATINCDGTIVPTAGECKEGMDISYKGEWGYAPLLISLAETREPLWFVNRSGNAPSHLGSAEWIDRSLDLVCGTFKEVWLRGDTDFSLTANFDRWDERCRFVFGMDARPNLRDIAESIPEADWKSLEKKEKYDIKTEPRRRPENVKERLVIERDYTRITTECESVAEFEYRPGKCGKTYRIVVLRKEIMVLRGEQPMFPDVMWFFYITNDRTMTPTEVVRFARCRCDHENDIEQLKSGVRALKAPSDSLESNWAYMVIAALAWNLKAWYGLLNPDRNLGRQIIRMEFRGFANTFINVVCLIVKKGRAVTYRFIAYNKHLKDIIRMHLAMRAMRFT
jgi:hypothetical protein